MKIRRLACTVVVIFSLQSAMTSCTERSINEDENVQIEMSGDEVDEPADAEKDEKF